MVSRIKGIPTSVIARLLGISYNSAQNKIFGRTEFTVGELVKLYNTYNIDLHDLVSELERIKKERGK